NSRSSAPTRSRARARSASRTSCAVATASAIPCCGLIGVVAQQVAWLAIEGAAEPGQGAEADGPGPAVLEHGQVDDGHADAVRQLGQRHVPLAEQRVEAYRDRRRLVLAVGPVAVVGVIPHIVAWISASMAAPA